MADALLHRARLFRDRAALDAAAGLIKEIGYYRRDGEIADACEALDDRQLTLQLHYYPCAGRDLHRGAQGQHCKPPEIHK